MKLQSSFFLVVGAFSGLCLSACQYLPQGAPSTWDTYLQAADTAVAHKNFDEAEKYLQLAVDDAEKKHSDDPSIFVIAASHYAEIQTSRGKYKDAEALYNRAIKTSEQHLAPNSPEIAKLDKALAQVLMKEGKTKEAKQLLSKQGQGNDKDKDKEEPAHRRGSSGSRHRGR